LSYGYLVVYPYFTLNYSRYYFSLETFEFDFILGR